MAELSAAAFEEKLRTLQSDEELAKIQRYFKSGEGEYGEGDVFIGVKMGELFKLAKAFTDMELDQIEVLLESPIHEMRAGAVSIMANQAKRPKTPEARRQALYDLYLRRHDRINNWDLVDLGAWHVVGRHLAGKPRDILYDLARPNVIWERRTAIYATLSFISRGEQDDAYAIAERLLNDPEDLIHKAAGGVLRWAGHKEPARLTAFLDKHAATMPRVTLRYAIEKLTREQRDHYLGLKKAAKA